LKLQLEQLPLTPLRGLPAGTLPEPPDDAVISVERTRVPKHGDFATNVALRLEKPRAAIRVNWHKRSSPPCPQTPWSPARKWNSVEL